MNKGYWEKFYKEKKITNLPTRFAKFCLNHIPKNSRILDMGCGNGRDSYFFAKNGHRVWGMDFAVQPETSRLAIFNKSDLNSLLESYRRCDFDIVYARFFLHAIGNFERFNFLNWTKGLLMIEFRVKEDKPVEFYNKHKRNLIDSDELVKDLLMLHGFKLLFYQKSKGLEIYRGVSPMVCRIIARKK